jgi:hypothetical protein
MDLLVKYFEKVVNDLKINLTSSSKMWLDLLQNNAW